MWRGFVCIEGRKRWHGREDKKAMMIVWYPRYIRVPAASIAGPTTAAVIANPPRTSKVLFAISSFLAVQSYVPGPLSYLLCMRVLPCIGHEAAVMNYAACDVET